MRLNCSSVLDRATGERHSTVIGARWRHSQATAFPDRSDRTYDIS
ncbi:hypothetical protein [Haladaptatus halobius]|nr:hypothetical protein [Haladaptatus halobius]